MCGAEWSGNRARWRGRSRCFRVGDPRPPRAGFTMVELLTVVSIIGVLAAIAIPNFLEAQVRSKISRARMEMAGVKLALGDYFADHGAYPPPPPTPEPPEQSEPQQEVQPLDSYMPYAFPPGMRPPASAIAPYSATAPVALPGAPPGVVGYPVPPGSAPPPVGPPMPGPPPGGAWGYPYPPATEPAPEEPSVASPLEVLTTPVPYMTRLPFDPFIVLYQPGPYGYDYPYEYRPHVGVKGEGLYLDTPGLRGSFLYTLWSYGPDQAGDTFFTEDFVSVLVYDASNGTTSSGDIVAPGP